MIEIEEKCKDTDNTKGLNNILQYISRNKKTYKVIFNANIDPMFPKKLLNLPIITEIMNNKLVNKNENKYKKIYILEGGYHVILKWLNNDCRESPEEITRLVMKYINQNL